MGSAQEAQQKLIEQREDSLAGYFSGPMASRSARATCSCWLLEMRLKKGRASVRRAMNSVMGSEAVRALGWRRQAGCR